MPDGFKIPDNKAAQLRSLLARERDLANSLQKQREKTNVALRTHLEMSVLPKTKAWLQSRIELASYMRDIWKEQHGNHKEWLNESGDYDASQSCVAANRFMRDLRECSNQVMDDAKDLARTSMPLFPEPNLDAIYKDPSRFQFQAAFPADTKAHILADMEMEAGEDGENDDDDEMVVPGIDETDNDALIEGLAGLSAQELDDFLSTVEGGLNVEELEKALAKLEG